MPDRSITYEFKGRFDSLRAGLAAGGRSVDDFGKKLTGLDARGEKMRRGLTDLGNAAGKVGLGAAAGLVAIVGVTAKFESAMSKVEAATGEGEAGMKALRDAAIQAGADTAFSASEAAAGIENLAKAGVSAQDILGGGLQGALDLAAAGELEVADAAEAAASAMSQFGLAGEDVPHIADLLAAAAGKAQGEVSDMAQALNQAGIVADQVGLSIEETTGGLAAFAEAGLIGSDAGTSFKTMLGSLTPNSAKAKELMDELGISAYDAQGNFVGLAEFAGNLQTSLGDLSVEQRNAALKTIFGSDAIRAATLLYENGATGVQEWIDKVDDSGFAAETAATKLDNLAGDFEALKGSIETALIGLGTDSQGPLRKLVQGMTDAVNEFNTLPDAAKNSVTGILAATAVLGGGLWATSKVINGIASTKQALGDLGITAGRTKSAMAGLGKGVQLGALLLIIPEVEKALEDLFDTRLNETALQRDLETLAGGKTVGEVEKLASWISQLDDNMGEFNQTVFGKLPGTDTLSLAEEELGKVDATLASMVESGNAEQAAAIMAEITAIAEEEGTSLNQLSETFTEYDQALRNADLDAPGRFLGDWAESAGLAADETDDAAGATRGLDAAAKDTEPSVRDLTKAMLDQANAAVGAFDAVTSYRRALQDADEQADKNNAGIQGNTDAALENRDALSGLATAWNSMPPAVRNNVEQFREAKRTFIDTAVAMGVPIKKARELADELLAIPKSRVAKVGLEGADPAITKANELRAAVLNIPLSRTVEVTFARHNIDPGRLYAQGGLISGPGTPTSDSIPAYVSRGEYVVKAAAVEKYGVAMFDRLNAMRFAGGGQVPHATPAPAGGGSIDYDRLAGAMLRARPLYGNVHISGDPATFKRELQADARRTSLGGFG